MTWRASPRGAAARRSVTGPSRRAAAALVALLAAATVAACSGAEKDTSTAPASHEYRPGLSAFPRLPTGATTAPVVVMVPGGSWLTADPEGLDPLAAALAEHGVVAMPVRIRAADDGVVNPVPVEDVLCALADGVATARAAGIEPTRTVLLGHSSGAHLAALATLTADQRAPDCDDPIVRPDALVGLAGPYDIRTFAEPADALFAPGASSSERDAANPLLQAALRPDVPVLLMHGDADEVVPASYSTDFGAALLAAGHATAVKVLPGEDHDTVYSPQVAEPLIERWLQGLPQD